MSNYKKFIKTSKKKHIICDFDGTVVQMHLPWIDYMTKVCEEFNKINPELINKMDKSILDHDAVNDVIKKIGKKAREIDLKVSEDFEMNRMEGFTENQELINFIEENYTSLNFYIWSTNTYKRIKSVLEEINLTHAFKKIIGKDQVELTKPYVDGFYKIFDPDKHDRKDFLMIGNNEHSDGGASRHSGIDFKKISIN